MDLGGICPHAFCDEHCTVKGNLGLSDLALRAIEDNAMLGCCLHELQEVPVKFLRSMAIDAFIIMNVNNARKSPLPGPCTSERCPGTFSGGKACTETGTCHGVCGKLLGKKTSHQG